MNIKNVYILDDRAILYINGEDAKEFLQNLISNDINKVNNDAKQLELSVTLLISLLIRFCRKSFASEPFI